jgi:hypothetical protein
MGNLVNSNFSNYDDEHNFTKENKYFKTTTRTSFYYVYKMFVVFLFCLQNVYKEA